MYIYIYIYIYDISFLLILNSLFFQKKNISYIYGLYVPCLSTKKLYISYMA